MSKSVAYEIRFGPNGENFYARYRNVSESFVTRVFFDLADRSGKVQLRRYVKGSVGPSIDVTPPERRSGFNNQRDPLARRATK